MHEITDLLRQVKAAEPSCYADLSIRDGRPVAAASLISDDDERYRPEGDVGSRVHVKRDDTYNWAYVHIVGDVDDDPAGLLRELLVEVTKVRRPRVIREEVVL